MLQFLRNSMSEKVQGDGKRIIVLWDIPLLPEDLGNYVHLFAICI